MRKPDKYYIHRSVACLLTSFIAILYVISSSTSCVYMKMNPPPDADKSFTLGNNSCWQATAANMLAGAGYGNGNTVQDRADDIYGDMTTDLGTANRGFTDTGINWWLGSTHNTWPNNPYTVVTVYGNKNGPPWANPDGARDIANELRACEFVGLFIRWPTDAPGAIGSGGHLITAWGDEVGVDLPLSSNPSTVRVTDSDRDAGGDVQVYNYDAYTNPNPGGPNEGNGWYIDFTANHPYIEHIITLCPTQGPGGYMTQKVVGSYKIHQSNDTSATDLHYIVGTDTEILSYRTTVNWETENPPSITESQPRRDTLEVDWDFSDKPVPYCEWITITTEFILRSWNAIWYDDVYFTYNGGGGAFVPGLKWEMKTPLIENASSIQDVTGGYVVGSFDIIDPELPPERALLGEYRFIHEYNYDQSPEDHVFILESARPYVITDVNFGHSYGYLDIKNLWEFSEWMTEIDQVEFDEETGRIEIPVDWEGRLPYPEGADIKGMIPDIKEGLIDHD